MLEDDFSGAGGKLTRGERQAWDGMVYAGGGRISRGDLAAVNGAGPAYRVIGFDLGRGRVLAIGPTGTALLEPDSLVRVGP